MFNYSCALFNLHFNSILLDCRRSSLACFSERMPMSRTFKGPTLGEADLPADSPAPSIAMLRDRAIIGALHYADRSIDAVIALRVGDYYSLGNRRWLRIVQDG